MKPTNEDLARLIPDAQTEAMTSASSQVVDGTPYDLAEDAHHVLVAIIRLLAATTVDWNRVRRVALRALYLCALIAWEAGRRMAPGWKRYADGDANAVEALPPIDPPSAAETPAAKHDVEALLREVEQRFGRFRGQEAPGDWAFGWTAERCAAELAAALRAERERAEALASVARGRERASGLAIGAHRHLRAVLDFMWPVGGWMTSPTVVQKARAFLAGDGQAPLHDDAREIELLRKELADKGAALARMLERYEQARREVLTEDEAHAHTRAQLAGCTRACKTWEKSANQHMARADAAELELARVTKNGQSAFEGFHEMVNQRNAANDRVRAALAGQNRAESEAAGLRAQLVDLETAIRGLVDRVEKGRA
jgi:hypothetical protein